MPKGKRKVQDVEPTEDIHEEEEEPKQKKTETFKKQLVGDLPWWRFYAKDEIMNKVKILDDKVQISNDIPSLYSVQFSDGSSIFISFSKIAPKATHICTPQHVSVKLEKPPSIEKSDRVLIFLAPQGNINLQWTTETHIKFPKSFKDTIFAFLLCQKRAGLNLGTDINKIIFSFLNLSQFQSEKLYLLVGEGKKSFRGIQDDCGFDLSKLISPNNVRLLNTKLERCFKNKYGAWLCFSTSKSKSKFADYD